MGPPSTVVDEAAGRPRCRRPRASEGVLVDLAAGRPWVRRHAQGHGTAAGLLWVTLKAVGQQLECRHGRGRGRRQGRLAEPPFGQKGLPRERGCRTAVWAAPPWKRPWVGHGPSATDEVAGASSSSWTKVVVTLPLWMRPQDVGGSAPEGESTWSRKRDGSGARHRSRSHGRATGCRSALGFRAEAGAVGFRAEAGAVLSTIPRGVSGAWSRRRRGRGTAAGPLLVTWLRGVRRGVPMDDAAERQWGHFRGQGRGTAAKSPRGAKTWSCCRARGRRAAAELALWTTPRSVVGPCPSASPRVWLGQ